MNDLTGMKQKLAQIKKMRDDWLMKGYDTPQLTYHEQLDEYDMFITRIEDSIKEKEMK